MSILSEQKRLDTLLGLAIVFNQISQESTDELIYPKFYLLLNEADQEQFRNRILLYIGLSKNEQQTWLKHVINQAHENTREKSVVIDQHIHPSYIVKVLEKEPKCVQSLILRYLPENLVSSIAAELNINLVGEDNLQNIPNEEILAILKRVFLSNFVTIDQLHSPLPFDFLSSIQLFRLIHMMGIRETSIACRGVSQIETVGVFLKRFSIEDSQAIANHMMAVTSIEPSRLDFAQRVVEYGFKMEQNSSAMLDFVGLLLLNLIFIEQDNPERTRFTMQKLPIAITCILENSFPIIPDPEIIKMLIDEVSNLTETLQNR